MEFNNLISSEYTIEIYSLAGKLHLSQTGIKNDLSVDIGNLSKGLYFIWISDSKQNFIRKFIKE
ncbi:MAG: T9SS type A sorting domain-containing protein [Bacteroidales bacterium]|nr:T9SS type A sorting domain-containing protein [Bacteroidales bacterium]